MGMGQQEPLSEQSDSSEEEMSVEGMKDEGMKYNRFMVEGRSEGIDGIYN
jgi:hypothetical protein